MNDTIKKAIKLCAAGVMLRGVLEFGCDIGKGSMLGTMLRHKANPEEVVDILTEYKEKKGYLRLAFIRAIALSRAKEKTEEA